MVGVLLHVVGQHPGGLALDYGALALIGLCLSGVVVACSLMAQPTPRLQRLLAVPRSMASAALAPVQRPVSIHPAAGVALSWLFLLLIAVQGFHVIEHIVLVVQVQALGQGLDEAHGLLGARVDFEWLHFSYNLSFLGVLVLLLVHGRWSAAAPQATPHNAVILALTGAIVLQTYHVVEHSVRMVQYYTTDCSPCVGLIGQVVLFIWPHLFFGLFAYAPLVAGYFAFGLHRQLGLPSSRGGASAP